MTGEPGIRIAASGPADAAAISGLIRQLAEGEGETSPITDEYARAYLASPGCHVLLARCADGVVGLVSYSLRPGLFHAASSCVIEDLIVGSGHRGRGIGRMLVAEVVQKARGAGCAEVSVTTATGNRRAQDLYRGLGLTDESLFLEKHFS